MTLLLMLKSHYMYVLSIDKVETDTVLRWCFYFGQTQHSYHHHSSSPPHQSVCVHLKYAQILSWDVFTSLQWLIPLC